MAGDALLDTNEFGRPANGFLQGAGADVVALGKSAARIGGELGGGEEELARSIDAAPRDIYERERRVDEPSHNPGAGLVGESGVCAADDL